MTRCPTCSSIVSVHTSAEGTSCYVPLDTEPRHVSIHDPALPEGQYRTEQKWDLADGGVLHLIVGRGKITREADR